MAGDCGQNRLLTLKLHDFIASYDHLWSFWYLKFEPSMFLQCKETTLAKRLWFKRHHGTPRSWLWEKCVCVSLVATNLWSLTYIESCNWKWVTRQNVFSKFPISFRNISQIAWLKCVVLRVEVYRKWHQLGRSSCDLCLKDLHWSSSSTGWLPRWPDIGRLNVVPNQVEDIPAWRTGFKNFLEIWSPWELSAKRCYWLVLTFS